MDSDHKKRKLTLEEKLDRYNHSKALSPKSAALKVKKMSGLHIIYWLREMDDLENMNTLTGELWDEADIDVEHFGSFCKIYERIKENKQVDITRHPLGGYRYANALILLLLGYISAIKSQKKWENPIKSYLHMTFEDYMGALYDLCQQDEILIRGLRNVKEYEATLHGTLDKPMLAVLEECFEMYSAALARFRYVRYMLQMAIDCTAIKNDWDSLPNVKRTEYGSPMEHFKRVLKEHTFDIKADDMISGKNRVTDLFYLKQFYARMTQPGYVHHYCRIKGIDKEFIDYIDAYLEEADLLGAMQDINMVLAETEAFFVAVPKIIYERDYRYEGHYDIITT